MRLFFICLTVALLLAGPAAVSFAQDEKPANEPVKLETEEQKLSYAFGMQIASALKAQNTEIDLDIFIQAVRDAMSGGETAMTENEVRELLMRIQQEQAQAAQAQMQAAAEENLAKAKAFLDANAKEEGVVVLDSGLQYKIIKEGTGRTPGPQDEVKTHYTGTLIDGSEFDSSFKRGEPARFPVHRVIPGWTEALQLMKEGAKWRLWVPPDLAYGPRQTGPNIPPNSALIFDIELIEVIGGGFQFQ